MVNISNSIPWKGSFSPSTRRRRHCEIFFRSYSAVAIVGCRACRPSSGLPGWSITGNGTNRDWQWSEELPLILLVSVTTSFFAWTYDHVVFLPALIEVTAWIKRTRLPWYRSWAVIGYLTINVVHAVMRFWFAEEFGYVWLAPALLLSYVVYRFEKQRKSAARLTALA